uniref:Uncharacterized protein n=1 Tax=Oryza nivara TaxID=4536 RepID=A0A0E0GZ95_ORYNI
MLSIDTWFLYKSSRRRQIYAEQGNCDIYRGAAYIYCSMNILESIRIAVLTDLSIGTHMDFYLFILSLLQVNLALHRYYLSFIHC